MPAERSETRRSLAHFDLKMRSTVRKLKFMQFTWWPRNCFKTRIVVCRDTFEAASRVLFLILLCKYFYNSFQIPGFFPAFPASFQIPGFPGLVATLSGTYFKEGRKVPIYRPIKDEQLRWLAVVSREVSNHGPLDWETAILTTRPQTRHCQWTRWLGKMQCGIYEGWT